MTGASLMRGSKVKPFRVSAFKGSAQNDKSGGRTSGSKLPKNSVKLKENEDTLTGSPQENDMPLSYASEANESIATSPVIHKLFKKWLRMLRTQSSCEVVDGILEEEPPPKEISETEHDTQNKERDGILRMHPWYLAVNIIYGAEVSKELTPLWVLGPLIVALYIKMLQWLCALYVFSFKQTVQVIKNLPTYYMVAYRYIAQGKLKEDIRAHFWQPLLNIKNLDYKKLSRRKLKGLQELIVEKYLDFIESIWPYYCRTIRFLKRANLI
ncbi:embryo defective 2759 [Prunus dulcis]|uniref:Embryo defective 2759 n=1 Tax=Prunus dulcis TaxID=3755 RepID=A0A4Y1RHW1_PRUDU|nr:embryo defective 2759 [Prunus dulcis]